MTQNNLSSSPQLPLDIKNPQLEHEEDLDEEYLKQNEIISHEIWKHDKSLYCPTRTFKVLTFIYLFGIIGYVAKLIPGGLKNKWTFLPVYAFYLLLFSAFFFNLITIWACIILWRVKNLKDLSKVERSIMIFKSFLYFAAGIELPIFLYYMIPIGLNSGWKPLALDILLPIGDIIFSGICLLMAIRIQNILSKNRPFYEASSFYVNMD